ncbi:uncharacterized protein LOC144638436 [Oculina patagonica]
MDFKLILGVMMLLALPFSAESGTCYLTRFNGGYYVGTGRVHTGFIPAIKLMNWYAYKCKVKIYLTSTFRKDTGGTISGAIVKPSKISNHFVGHAIDMNLIDGRNFCNSRCLGDVSKHTPGVKCFIAKIRQNSVLRWGGDFTVKDVVHIDDGINIRYPNAYKILYKWLQSYC